MVESYQTFLAQLQLSVGKALTVAVVDAAAVHLHPNGAAHIHLPNIRHHLQQDARGLWMRNS